MKKAKLLTVAVLVIVTLSMTVLQVGASRIIAPIDETRDIDYSHCANIPSEIVAQIVNPSFGLKTSDNTDAVFHSIWCIFGHSISTGVIITTHHRAYTANPRCRETWTHVEFCNRCSHFVVVRETSMRISCC